ncbi:hypothetical protein RHMOL_Rhmol04G0194500 [Rhododendron molle]|uniref:Uncharacterized protein n=1 Tax=Rhododendron molle TaxID=49168 RepID=A0ACC0P3F1_RHOML|nr:hypothetical protein RHMOL_Rhmol04G0194500 [Rhododendron molle]
MVGDSSGDVGGSGAVGDDPGPNGSPLRDSAKGKGVVIVVEEPIEKEQTIEAAPVEIREENIEIREVDIAFRPPAMAATS